jgi:Monooxygenase af470-like
MARVIPGRMTADIEGDFVVFLIGMRFNKPWKIHKWWGVFTAMPRMLRELAQNPEIGLLGTMFLIGPRGPVTVQYWRSVEQLEAFARDPRYTHRPAWKAFNKLVGGNGDVGIWHESYMVKAGQYETLYGNMPPFGLATAREAEHLPVARKGQSAAARRGVPAAVSYAPTSDESE